MPFFTIITATYNAAAVLPRLLDSLAGQSCRDFELIIQDGASNDGTVSIAENYRDKLPALILNSEPDKGIYEAWNRALEHVRGEWAIFLGADDALEDSEVFATALGILQSFPPEVIYGAGDLHYEASAMSPAFIQKVDVSSVVKKMPRHMPVPHPALFYRTTIFKTERFDASFRIAGDYDFLAKTWKKPEQGRSLGIVVSFMGQGGCSNMEKMAGIMAGESLRIRRKYFFGRHILVEAPEIRHKLKMSMKNICMKNTFGRILWATLKKIHGKILGSSERIA